VSNPIHQRGLVVLRGNLATSAVMRYSVFPEGLRKFTGPARTFDSIDEASRGLRNNEIKRGDAIVVKYEGPRGGPGMPDLLNFMYEVHGANLVEHCPLITDGKFSGFAEGGFICQVTPEAAVGGPLAVVKDNDVIDFDVDSNKLNVDISDEELRRRLEEWRPAEPKVKRGYLTLWQRMANSAAKGAGLPYNI
jgi:dihydroxy-acid dehydratase